MSDPTPTRMTAPDRRLLVDLIVRTVAANLTAPQRAALLWLPADGSERAEDGSVRSLWHLTTRKVCKGVEATLATHSNTTIENGHWAPYRWRLTAFGARVREVIEAEGKVSAS